ncbi:MAG: hypothetical protein IJ809_05345 [Clostridia bacterium]|nr:hypothetical protein [Clostridia bacterium]
MEELERKLDEIKGNIDRLKEITEVLARQSALLDRLDSISTKDRIDKEVID